MVSEQPTISETATIWSIFLLMNDSSDDYLDDHDDGDDDDDDDDDTDEAFEAKDGSSNGGVTVWFGGFNFFSTARPQSRPLFLTIGVACGERKIEVFVEQTSTYCSRKKLKFGGFNFFPRTHR